jgi:hypothetical protein
MISELFGRNFIDRVWFPCTKSVAVAGVLVIDPHIPPLAVVSTLNVASPPGSRNVAIGGVIEGLTEGDSEADGD